MDVEYKKPKKLGGSFMIGFLGTSAHIEGSAKNKQKTRDVFTYILGIRYKTNAYLLNSMDTKGDYKPNFFDTQMLLGWNISDKFEIGLLGNLSINKYLFVPSDRQTRYGSMENPKQFTVYFDGQEIDKYENYLGGLTFTYRPNLKNQLKLILSSYYAKESETFDIQSQYWLSDSVGVPFDDPSHVLDFGEFNHLKANIFLNTVRITGFVQDTWKIDSDISPRYGGILQIYGSSSILLCR